MRDFSIRMNLCVAVCCSVSGRDQYCERKLVEEAGRTPEGAREDGFTGVQRNIYQKEILPQYKLTESNLNHSPFVGTNYEIFGLIKS